MARPLTVVLGVAVAAAGYAAFRHLRPNEGHEHEGDGLIGNTAFYDITSKVLFGSFYRGVADDVAPIVPDGGRVLDVGCGPGRVALDLADRGLDVAGVDLDPAMIERARAHAVKSSGRKLSFDVGNAAALPYDDDSFDLVVSTFALHHWSEPEAALNEIARVLQPGGVALVWDFESGNHALHSEMPDPASHFDNSPLEVVTASPWRWPLGFTLTQRMELRLRDQPT